MRKHSGGRKPIDPSQRSINTGIRLTEGDMATVDAIAKARGLSRGGVLRLALAEFLAARTEPTREATNAA
jgi:hypothetical protein